VSCVPVIGTVQFVSRTTIDVDDEACRVVMDRYDLASKEAAVNFALRLVASEASAPPQAREVRGSGWDGDLDDLRASRVL
jgi:Arc/MetJ family transcription regulator